MRSRTSFKLAALAAVSALCTPAFGAELYKWVDEQGVTNYSNEPPATKRPVKKLEADGVSVYTPDASLTQAVEAERNRRAAPPPAAALPAPPPPAAALAPPPPPQAVAAPPLIADPCLNSGDPNCISVYDGSPVFAGRRRAVPLVQPQLPPGAIAGNVNANTGYTPGLSNQAPPAVPPPRTRPRSSTGTGTGSGTSKELLH